MTEVDAILIYCKSARKAKSLGLCKLQIKDEIQPRIEKLKAKLEDIQTRANLEGEHFTYDLIRGILGEATL